MASAVESAMVAGVQALCDGQPEAAAEVVGREPAIDRWEVRIERECLRVLTLYEPVATDLRRVATVLKVNGDLERIADLAAHIARRARRRADDSDPVPVPESLRSLAREAVESVRACLRALAAVDVESARAVIAGDRQIDRLRRAAVDELKQAIRRDPDKVNGWLRLINTARNLERAADHATNIAEAVVFLKDGEIIRHTDRGPSPAEPPGGQP
jgi:phosphate transport system protein